VVYLVVVGVVRDRVAEVGAQALVHKLGHPMVVGVEHLQHLELLGGRFAQGEIEAGALGKADRAHLAEILHPTAPVARPLVFGRFGIEIDGGEGELVQPTRDAAMGVHIAGCLAGA